LKRREREKKRRREEIKAEEHRTKPVLMFFCLYIRTI
jgi:hypothetical protein